MSEDIKNIGIGTTVIINDLPITFKASFSSTTLSIDVASCNFNLIKTVKERFHDLNVIIPEDSGKLSVAKFKGAISKTDAQKKTSTTGEYRLIKFEGEMEQIPLPIPLISDINIDKAFFYYQYLSAKSSTAKSNFTDQIIYLGCNLSVKEESKLSTALTGATLKSAYFLSNNASVIYFAFSGKINIGKIIEGIFGVITTNLTIDIQSAGIFRIAKTDAQKTIPGVDGKPDETVPQLPYIDALTQIASLENDSEGPTDDSDVMAYMPSTFPLAQKEVTENGIQVTKVGIRAGNEIDTDFTTQFTEAFSEDNVTGICFWAIIDFNQISLFNSLITIGYTNDQVNSLILYGFRTQNQQAAENATGSAYFYAQLPPITLTLFFPLKIGGLNGRQGILFKYTTNNNQYELNATITFTAFEKQFIFGGDLVVNNDHLLATLNLTVASPNSGISKPLGMTGINFARLYLYINKTFAKKATDTQPEIPEKCNLIIGGFIDFNFNGTVLQLQGNVVFDKESARLVIVSLNATPALTLNHFVKEVVKKPWDWVDQITKQIGFISGTMYYLSVPDTEKDNEEYTFTYNDALKISPQQKADGFVPVPNSINKFTPGYHINANLLLFEKYVFKIEMSIVDAGVTVSGSYGGIYENNEIVNNEPITAFFISLKSPKLTISTVGGASFRIEIENLTLFGTDIGSFSAGYHNGIFIGSYNHTKPNFGFEWQWTKKQGIGDFSITKINGIDAKELDAITAMVKRLNSIPGGGCESVVKDMFGQLKTSFKPALQGGKKPIDKGNGYMHTPLQINYYFSVGSTTIISDSIQMDLDVKIPKSIHDLPQALIDTLIHNMSDIIEQLLSNPTFYKAIALEMAKKGAAQLAARMLCRASKEIAETLAKSLADAMSKGLIDAGLAGLLELGGVVTGVLAAGITGAIGGLLDILKKVWDEIKKIFGDDSGKKEAQNKLNEIKAPVQQLISSMTANLNRIAATIQVQSLKASIDNQSNYRLDWIFPAQAADLGSNTNLEYQLKFLEGEIGTAGTDSRIPAVGFKLMTAISFKKAWSSMLQEDPDFRMNAAIQTSITGYTFMTQAAEDNFNRTINTLNQIGNSLDGAVDFNNQLKSFVDKMKAYNTNGLTSKLVYAQCEDSSFRVGRGILGVNTII